MVTVLSGLASTDAAIDSIGVMPEPAAMHRCRPPRAGSARKLPEGSATSTVSPGATWWISHDENMPPGISRTPMRGAAPAGAQME